MSNHYHVILCVKVREAETWTDIEVIERWRAISEVDPGTRAKRLRSLRQAVPR